MSTTNTLYTQAAAAGYIDEETAVTDAFQLDCWLHDTTQFELFPQVERWDVSFDDAMQALVNFDGDVDAAAEWLNSD